MDSVNRIQSHCIQVAKEILDFTEDITCSVKPLSDGLNFMSDAYFVEVKSGEKELSLFAKVRPETNELRKLIFDNYPPELYPFQREFFFFHSVRNLFENVVEENAKDATEILDFIPKPYILPGPVTFNQGLEEPLTCEDLNKLGYKMWKDEFNGLDIPHAEVALEAYGRLHALGMVLFEKGEIKDDNLTKLFNFNPAAACIIPAVVEGGMKAFHDWMENNNYAKEALEKVQKEMKDKNYMKTIEKLFEEGISHEMQVIQHFDARSNNMLFNYALDNTTPEKIKLVDFQLSSFFPPFWDLVYFLALSVSSDSLIPNYQSLIERYQASLASTLTKLKYKKPIPSTSYITQNITHFAPMVFPLIAGVTEYTSGAGNPDLDPELRQNKIRSGVKICDFLGIFGNTTNTELLG